MGPLEKLKLRLVNGLDSEDIKTLEHIEARRAELLALKAELEARNAEPETKPSAPEAATEPKPVAAAPEPETAPGFFDQKDAEALKASLSAEQEARDAKKRKAEDEDRVIREAMIFAMDCLLGALKELPRLAEASGLEYVKLYTGACRPETEIIEEEYRSGLSKREIRRREERYDAFFYVDTNGKVEKHCSLDRRRAATDIREGSFEDIRSTFRSEIDGAEYKAVEWSSRGSILDRIVFEGGWGYTDGEKNYDYKDRYRLNCMRSREEIVKTVKEMIFWCLTQKKDTVDWPQY